MDDFITVTGASGATFEVLNEDEANWLKRNLKKYKDQFKFDNISDLQDLDRLLHMELLSHRWGIWLMRGMDYDGKIFDEREINMSKKETDREIRLLKQALGMSRVHRMTSEQQNVADYLGTLLQRAKEFGVHRDEQIAAAIDILMELRSKVLMHDRCDEEERASEGVTMEDIFEWIRDVAIVKYDSIDDAFRVNQKLWIKEIA